MEAVIELWPVLVTVGTVTGWAIREIWVGLRKRTT